MDRFLHIIHPYGLIAVVLSDHSDLSEKSEKFIYSDTYGWLGEKMTKDKKNKTNSEPKRESKGCCKVEYVTKVDDRGQMVLPKGIREKAGIRSGDRLAVVSMEKDGKVCCISLIKVEELEGKVKDLLGPVMKEVLME